MEKGVITKKRFIENYKGFRIYKETTYYKRFSAFTHTYIDSIERQETFYICVKDGNENKPSMYYDDISKDVNGIKEKIDRFLSREYPLYTHADYKKYVSIPNRKNQYAFGNKSLMQLLKQYQKADFVVRTLLIERLTAANFHGFAACLENGEIEKYKDLVNKEFPIVKQIELTITACNVPSPDDTIQDIQNMVNNYLSEMKCKASFKANIIL